MSERLLLGFAIALVASVLGTPLVRRVALAVDLVDQPAERKVHLREMPYLGGIAIAGAVFLGTVAGGTTGWRVAVITVAAAALGLVGLLDDDRTLSVAPRLAVQVGAALAAVVAGVRAQPFGIVAYDVTVTVLWIVVITNAVNLLDNMDGLAGGVTLAASAGVVALAAFGDQPFQAVFAAATGGACVGFLAYNWRPASIFMGDAGALFLGYVFAVSALLVRPAIPPPGGFAVPLLLSAVPLLDTATVVLARSRRRIPVLRGGRDHLSHRLVARGLAPASAVTVLVVTALVEAGLAVFAGRGLLPVWLACAVGAVPAAVLLVVAGRAHVYRVGITGWSPRVRRWLLAGSLVTGAVLTPVLAGTVAAGFDAVAARGALGRAEIALRDGDIERASAAFRDAATEFDDMHGRLRSPLVGVGRYLPLLGPNIDALQTLAQLGSEFASLGADLVTDLDPDRLSVRNGTIPIERIAEIRPRLEAARQAVESIERRARGLDDAYLVAPLANALDEVEERLASTRVDVRRAADAARLVPAIFGGHGTRRYFLAVQNSAELRATGGFIGNWGMLTAEDGRLRLDDFDRVSALNPGADAAATVVRAPEDFLRRYGRFDIPNTWQNVNMSPDFPTVARVMADLLPQSGQPPVDGVLAVDPLGLSALLELTGPVTVTGWPEPITAENVVVVTLKDAYEHFEEVERVEFLGDTARAVWEAVTSTNLGRPDAVAEALSDAVVGGHLVAWLRSPEEQDLLEDLAVTGGLPPVQGDSLMVVTQNAAGNKVDYYLRRSVRYEVRLEPDVDGSAAAVDATLSVELHNDAPGQGLPRVVIGPYDDRFRPGENVSFTTIYTPLLFSGATVDGEPTPLEALDELGRHAYSTYVRIPPGASRRLEIALTGTTVLNDGWYRLDLPHQPTLKPNDVELRVEVPEGWRVTAARPAGRQHARSVALRLAGEGSRTVWVRIERARSLLDRLRDGH